MEPVIASFWVSLQASFREGSQVEYLEHMEEDWTHPETRLIRQRGNVAKRQGVPGNSSNL